MKIPFLLILLTTLFSCKNHVETKKIKGDLNYTATDLQTQQISAGLNLTANIKAQEVRADLELNNPGDSAVTITEVELSTPEGLRSLPKTGNIGSIVLKPGENKTIPLKFQPLNDLKEYRLTGRNGYFKPSYNLLITCKTDQNRPPIQMTASLSTPDYKAYLSKHKTKTTSYSFNTKSDFTEKQKAYLKTIKQIKQSPFVFVSDQEIAISGVNFRLTSFCENDTLNAQIFIVNHSGFPIGINKDYLDFHYINEPSSTHAKDIRIIKISGSPKKDMIEKGDRVLIHFKKYFKNTGHQAELSLHKVFELSDKSLLFKDDIELIKVNLP